MALANSFKRISPLDLNKNVTIGVQFPLDRENLQRGSETSKEQARTDLMNLILTEPGERVFLLDYGVGLKRFLFEQGDQNTLSDIETALRARIEKQIEFYLPQISLKDIFCYFNEEINTLTVKIVYNYRLDNTKDAIQLNFKR